jgi:pimeloyl-ACP methyl ester carboxylesterase
MMSIKQLMLWITMICFPQYFSFSYDYNVTHYHIIDTSRQELYPHDAAHPFREFMMHVWFPIAQEQSCPLILFSHGLGNNFNGMMYTQLCQYCASRGYVVASVSHTYSCKSLSFPDGTITSYLFPAPVHHQPGKHMYDTEADMWVEDMLCALNECEQQNASEASLLYKKIDMSCVGVIGHSLGGSVAIQLCRRDNRISAAINLDGPLYGTNCLQPINKPLMLIVGSLKQVQLSLAHSLSHNALYWRWYFDHSSLPQLNSFISSLGSDVYKITIDGIVHETFSDLALSPDPIIARWVIDGTLAHTIIHSYVGAFFDHYLKKSDVPLLQENVSCWSNVVVERR